MSFLPDTENWSLQSFSRIINLHCSGDSWVIQETRAQIRAESLCHMPFINLYTYLRIPVYLCHLRTSPCACSSSKDWWCPQGPVCSAFCEAYKRTNRNWLCSPASNIKVCKRYGFEVVWIEACQNSNSCAGLVYHSLRSTPAVPVGVLVSLHLQNSCLGPKGHPLLLAVRMLQKFLVLQGFSYFIRPEELRKWRTSIQPKV